MTWHPHELDVCLDARRMLENISVLVNEFPPGDPTLPPAIQAAAAAVLGGKYPDKFEARRIRVFRAYAEAGRAVNQPASSRNGAWTSCKDELEHAHAGD